MSYGKIDHDEFAMVAGLFVLPTVGRVRLVPLLHLPGLLHASQWGLLLLETASPLMLVGRPRLAALGAAGWALFHLVTWASIGIHFLPTAICLTAFWPLEALPAWRDRRRAVRAARGQPPAVPPPPAGGYVAARR